MPVPVPGLKNKTFLAVEPQFVGPQKSDLGTYVGATFLTNIVLTSEDVVRHSLVGRIVDAYTEYDARQQARQYERDEAREFANRAERRAATPRDHLPKRQGPAR